LRFNLREIVEAYKKKHGKVPRTTYYAKDGDGITRPRGQDDIVAIVKDTVFEGLGELGLLADFSASAMEVHYRSNGGLVPFTYRRDLTFHDFARFAERNIGIPGVTVTRTGQRRYLYDSLACHILGYMSLADLDKVDEEKKREFTYYVGDDYGVHGIEKTMDSYLQGKPGIIKIEKNEKRKFLGVVERSEPTAGSDVYLTIDARLQYATAQSLRKVGRGAAVAIDPSSGDILAIASVPSYNPNKLLPGNVSAADWKQYTTDVHAPLFSRALNPYSPGSTCKIPIALSGCLSNSWKMHFSCGGGKQFGNKFMKCWSSGHGSVDLSNSIKRSCNGFYYRYANHTGIDNITKMTRMLGMGRVTGIRVTGEKPGTIPNPEWLRQKGLNWSPAFTALTSIGQGFTEATPLQMASVTATVANGGKVYQPRIVKRVMDREGLLVLDEPPKVNYDLTREGVTSAQIEIVRRGMWRVVNESGGTAGRAKSPITTISGKTGTAQTGNAKEPTNAWFIAFAPYENPEIAVCVFVQNGNSGGAAASPIAKNIIENYFALKKGAETMKLTKLPEAKGDRRRIMSVSFDNSDLIASYNTPPDEPAEEDEDISVDVADFVPRGINTGDATPASNKYVKPTIRKEIDSRGTIRQFTTPRPTSRWDSQSRRRRFSN
ncbi:MAG: penicillin-binding transpeptidase domain-containing protein, partial [Verrucomicrobiales bacterium]|nr:penicillin-binding transpeptidase domain-containing protein [Verrucomicrobiales bacterium]